MDDADRRAAEAVRDDRDRLLVLLADVVRDHDGQPGVTAEATVKRRYAEVLEIRGRIAIRNVPDETRSAPTATETNNPPA